MGEGVKCMKQELPAVRVVYAEAGKDLAQLAEESFRLYLARVLAAPAHEAAGEQPPASGREP